MGSSSRIKPEFLAGKLSAIRNHLEMSQTQLAEKLSSAKVKLRRSDISRYELGLREPSLIFLFQYARLANVTMEMLVDDAVDVSEFEKRLK